MSIKERTFTTFVEVCSPILPILHEETFPTNHTHAFMIGYDFQKEAIGSLKAHGNNWMSSRVDTRQ